MSIYVEIRIRGDLEDLWRLSQTPELHERWDLRFTTIEALEAEGDESPFRFRYATRIGFGLAIEGWGESVTAKEGPGRRTSVLRFGSESPWSLIREGSGYWRYEADADGLRFITRYDYTVRWGVFGRALDRLLFRPIMGWATAWSFDRLRLWIEEEIPPRSVRNTALVHASARIIVAFVWLWHGLVPKLMGPHPDEVAMMIEGGLAPTDARAAVLGLGVLEITFGVVLLIEGRRRWPWILTLAAMLVATVGVALNSPQRLWAAFNPVSLNLLMATLALCALFSQRDLASARRCLRRPDPEHGERKDDVDLSESAG